MTENVDPEEALAIRDLMHEDAAGSPSAVSGRDFRRPRRLSGGELGAIRGRVEAHLVELQTIAKTLLGDGTSLQLADLGEANAELALGELHSPLAAARFSLAGQPAWVVWDNVSALGAVERIMGSAPATDAEPPEPRGLTAVEAHVLGGFFANIVDSICRTFALDAEALEVVRDLTQIGSWRDGDPAGADSHRLCVSLALDGDVPPGVLRLYLPGFLSASAVHGARDAVLELPRHLAPVRVRARVKLGTVEVPLADLLALEEGDVIPLDVPRGSLVDIDIEGHPSARGTLGSHRGRYAVRIQETSSAPPRTDVPQ